MTPGLPSTLLDAIADPVYALDDGWRFTYANAAAAELLGRARESLLGRVVWDEFPSARTSIFAREYRRLRATGRPVRFRRWHAGRARWFDVRAWPHAGGLVAVLAPAPTVASDANSTARAQPEPGALVESEALLHAVAHHYPDGAVVLFDHELRCLVADGEAITGAPPRGGATVAGRAVRDVWPAPAAARLERVHQRALAGETLTEEYEADGRACVLRVRPVRDGAGRVLAGMATVQDVTAARRAGPPRRLLERALAHINDVVIITGARELDEPGPRIVWVNAAFEQLTGRRRDEVIGRSPRLLQGPDTDRAALARVGAALRRGAPVREVLLNYARDGTAYWLELDIVPIHDGAGALTHFVSVERDVTARMRDAAEREQLLRQRDAERRRLAAVLDELPVGVLLADAPTGALALGNRQLEAVLGLPLARLVAEGLDAVGARDARDARDEPLAADRWPVRRVLAGDRPAADVDVAIPRPGAPPRRVTLAAAPVRDDDGACTAVVMTAVDVTAQRALEQQVRQAQKMEAVGRLAGGIAHDFNNLLMVVRANAEFALGALPNDAAADQAREDLGEVIRSAGRAASLTRQLLAFSRQQALRPQVLDVGAVVRDVQRMLERVIGKDVRLHTEVAPPLPAVHADRGQLEQVLMNLAVNARDAMPDPGGVLTVRVAPWRPGAAVPAGASARALDAVGPGALLTVSDTGCGMDAATREHAFDPFFTTKELGQGTGLGLATVYGIVQQSGGTVWIDSAPGRGTTVGILLPGLPADARGDPPPEPLAEPPPAPTRGAARATALLVEDDPAVRALTARMLAQRGWRVVEAGTGAEALVRWRALGDEVALVITDVVMPDLGGRELARRIRAERPRLPILFVSGHPGADALDVPGDAVALLGKPYSARALDAALREILPPAPPRDA